MWFKRKNKASAAAQSAPSTEVPSPLGDEVPGPLGDETSNALRAEASRKSDVVVTHGGHRFVFGLHWQLVKTGEMGKLHRQALTDGYTHRAVSIDEDLIGFIQLPKQKQDRSRIYSAALLISEHASLGGDEIFVFPLNDTQFGLVALKESLPLPGFDLIGDADRIFQAAQDYLSLPHKNDIRQCGDPSILSGPENFEFDLLHAQVQGSSARLRTVRDDRKLIKYAALLASLLALLGAAWMGKSYLDARAEAERAQREYNPDAEYEKALASAKSSVRGLGLPMLHAITDTMLAIPLEVAGWSLNKVDCTNTECEATWNRVYGNFADFNANLPPDVKQAPEYSFLTTLNNLQLKTKHPVATEARGVVTGFEREVLPVVDEVKADLVSRLQDYALIGVKTEVSGPASFPSGSRSDGAFKPVAFGTWSLDLPLWSLQELELPAYVAVESLSMSLGDIAGKKDETKSLSVTYKLTGKYYAKGKLY